MTTQTNNGERRELPMMRREAAIIVDSLDEAARTFNIMWTAGAEVQRMDWWTGQRYVEVLDVNEKSMRLDRLRSGRAPVLNSHSQWGLDSVLGVIGGESVRVEKGEGFATVRLSKRENIAPLVADIRDKIICNVSPGYLTHSYREEMRDGKMYRIATDWEPIEISFVPVGADPDAGLRSAEQRAQVPTFPCRVIRAPQLVDVNAAAARMRMLATAAGLGR
jgi:hypothetical protein